MIQELFDKVYVISLPSCKDRRSYVCSHLQEFGILKFDLFDATGPDDLSVREAYKKKEVFEYPPCFRCDALDCGKPDCNNFLIPQQVATFITYLRLWKKISEGLEERVLVVEDDVCFHEHFADMLTFINSKINSGVLPFIPGKPCLLRLGWAYGEDHQMPASEFQISTDVRMSNPCHALTREYAKQLLDRFTMINHTADTFQHLLAPKAGEAFTLFPPIASELSWTEGVFPSTIHPKQSHSDYLKKTGNKVDAQKNDINLQKHIKKKYFRDLLVVGHPRCGTGFSASLCNQLGLEVGHEQLGKSGISSWMFAVDADEYPWGKDIKNRSALIWKYTILPLRDISTGVESVVRDSMYAPNSYEFRRDKINEYLTINLDDFSLPLEQAVWSITSWVRIILKMNPDLIFRIEDESEKVRAFLIKKGLCDSSYTGIPLDLSLVNANKPYQGQKQPKPSFNFEDWQSLSLETKEEVRWYCNKFGYKIPYQSSESEKLHTLFLKPSGWQASANKMRPVDQKGKPLPWFTYGAIEFLNRVVRRSDSVFEFGAGYSTLWWQSIVDSVVSVEHDEEWCKELRPKLSHNVILEHIGRNQIIDADSSYVMEAFFKRDRQQQWTYDDEKVIRRGLDDEGFTAYANRITGTKKKFDFIVVDGMARRLCVYMAMNHLKADGFIILDNSNRSDYGLAFQLLDENGFKQIPFWGLVPGASFYTCTSFFFKSLRNFPSGKFEGNSFDLYEY